MMTTSSTPPRQEDQDDNAGPISDIGSLTLDDDAVDTVDTITIKPVKLELAPNLHNEEFFAAIASVSVIGQGFLQWHASSQIVSYGLYNDIALVILPVGDIGIAFQCLREVMLKGTYNATVAFDVTGFQSGPKKLHRTSLASMYGDLRS
ncbi:hypothetical protein PG994_001410 [Apiospora phragmitis]|uniref:Uncharacterized protein n=1 Tax=Apiospora phragmitis TaxID=2905665 RepID=A0ABR1WTE2_9PEZI